MIILGSTRYVTQDFSHHRTAEDYSGNHLSALSITGRARVIRIVNHYKSHEDSINYEDFLNNQYNWKDGNYYNCVSITGKQIRYKSDELGGNCVILEGYVNGEYRSYGLYHMASVSVNVGDIVDSNTILGYQGNTGLVASMKDKSDNTYGTHVHMEVRNSGGNYLDPRSYATGEYKVDYVRKQNGEDKNKNQFLVLADKINIREQPTTASNDIGDVYYGEFYNILDIVSDDSYTWYKINTNNGIVGYVANNKDNTWLEIRNKKQEEIPPVLPSDSYKFIFKCPKSDTYYIKLEKDEEVYIKNN